MTSRLLNSNHEEFINDSCNSTSLLPDKSSLQTSKTNTKINCLNTAVDPESLPDTSTNLITENIELNDMQTPPTSPTSVRGGTRYKLITENDIQLCRLNHTKTLVSKIMNSRYLRRWETHHLMLGISEIWSTMPTSFMETSIPYSSIQDINIVSRWDVGHKFCIRITIPDGSVLLQVNNSYIRDQWFHSIQWKRYISKYDKLLRNTKRLDVLTKEIKQLIELSLTTPIQDDSVSQFPLELVSLLLKENADSISHIAYEEIIIALAPLLEKNHPTQQMCEFFIRHCKNSPRSQITLKLFMPVIHRILKHSVDFGKHSTIQIFIQEYIQALSSQNNSKQVVDNFITSMHGTSSQCPHPRVLPNLVSVCLSTIYTCYEDKKQLWSCRTNEQKIEDRLIMYIKILQTISEHEDWRKQLAVVLQPIPLPDDALVHGVFTQNIIALLNNIVSDHRCEVHTCVLNTRELKPGWFDIFCPGTLTCPDDGQLYCAMLKKLIECCCRRKKFFVTHLNMIGQWQLLALRENPVAIEALCAVLELDICAKQDDTLQVVTSLQSSLLGKKMYNELCQRQIELQEIQQKGGPRKLTMPSRSTDDDVRNLFSSGSFGNLECLSLAFSQVTSACAYDLIKLPALRYLNLWSTQFGDVGLQIISDYMPKLQVLNLCETPVTDKGLSCLTGMRNLRRLNLNSTYLSAPTFQELKEKLPCLKECDVRYTDAW